MTNDWLCINYPGLTGVTFLLIVDLHIYINVCINILHGCNRYCCRYYEPMMFRRRSKKNSDLLVDSSNHSTSSHSNHHHKGNSNNSKFHLSQSLPNLGPSSSSLLSRHCRHSPSPVKGILRIKSLQDSLHSIYGGGGNEAQPRDFDTSVRSSQSDDIMIRTSTSSGGPAKRRPSVLFQAIEIREYERTVGDNPSCSSGPPVSYVLYHTKVLARGAMVVVVVAVVMALPSPHPQRHHRHHRHFNSTRLTDLSHFPPSL